MATALSGRGVHHACDVDPGAVAHAHLFGGLLLPFRVSGDFDRAVRTGRGRVVFLRCGQPWRKHLLQAGRPGGDEQRGRFGVAGLHSDACRRARQSHAGGCLFRKRAAVLFFGRGGLYRRGGRHPARGSRVLFRSARRRRRLPGSGSVSQLFWRPEYGDRGVGSVGRVGGHLVQPGRQRCAAAPAP